MIETLNESELHSTLKRHYAEKYGGKQEVLIEGKMCDVATGDGGIIEIQTTSLAKQAPKIALLVPTHPFRLVYPLATEKYIATRDETEALLTRRKSPKRLGLPSIFRELTGIYPWLLHPHFTLEILPVTIAEKRVRTPEAVQLPNKSRRFRKPWYHSGKVLLSMGEPRCFRVACDYLALLPQDLPAVFTKKALKATAGNYAGYMVWVLERMGLIEYLGKQGREKTWEITRTE
jgi:hypothetical protein